MNDQVQRDFFYSVLEKHEKLIDSGFKERITEMFEKSCHSWNARTDIIHVLLDHVYKIESKVSQEVWDKLKQERIRFLEGEIARSLFMEPYPKDYMERVKAELRVLKPK